MNESKVENDAAYKPMLFINTMLIIMLAKEAKNDEIPNFLEFLVAI